MKASPNYSRFTEVLLTWQELHRELLASAPLTSWNSARLLVGSAKSFDDYARQHLEDALARSDAKLWPLRDPLKLNLGAHRWLSADREESYSDWLAWILQGMSDAAKILPLFALGDDAKSDTLGRAEKIHREVSSQSRGTGSEAPALLQAARIIWSYCRSALVPPGSRTICSTAPDWFCSSPWMSTRAMSLLLPRAFTGLAASGRRQIAPALPQNDP